MPPGGARPALAVAQAIGLTLTGSLPVFLTGAMAVQVTAALGIGPAGLGLASSLLFATSGIAARSTGTLVHARGIRFGSMVAAGCGGLSLVLIATAQHYAFLLVAMVLGGIANAMAQPTANVLLSQAVGPRRLGLAMSIKQSYIPISSLLGGLSVPTLTAVFGWRWAISLGAVICLLVAAAGVAPVRRIAASRGAESSTGRPRQLPRQAMLVLTVGCGISAGAATSIGVFLVDSAVVVGISPGTAGYLLAICSALSLTTRISLGWIVDRVRDGNLYLWVANLLTLTVLGFVLLAASSPTVFVCGAVAAYLGWSWTGILHLAIVRDNEGAVAKATGYLQTGLALGAAAGPISLGFLAEHTSYSSAWLITAAVGLAGALVVHVASRMIQRSVREAREEHAPASIC